MTEEIFPLSKRLFLEFGAYGERGCTPEVQILDYNWLVSHPEDVSGNWQDNLGSFLDTAILKALACCWELGNVVFSILGEPGAVIGMACGDKDIRPERFDICAICSTAQTGQRLKLHFPEGNILLGTRLDSDEEDTVLHYGDAIFVNPEVTVEGCNCFTPRIFFGGVYKYPELPAPELYAIGKGMFFPRKTS